MRDDPGSAATPMPVTWDSAGVTRAVRDEHGRIVDFVIEMMTTGMSVTAAGNLIGKTLSSTLGQAAMPFIERYVIVVKTQEFWSGRIEIAAEELPRWHGRLFDVALIPFGERVVALQREVVDSAVVDSGGGLAQAILDQASDVVQISDVGATVLYVSPAIERILGYRPEEILGQVAPRVPPEYEEAAWQIFGATVAGQPGEVFEGEFPLLHKDGSIRWSQVRFSNQLHHPAIRGILCNWSDVTTQHELLDSLHHRAMHDALTGLPNRRLFDEHLGLAVSHGARSGHPFLVAFIDVDHFKLINDTYGHTAGDALLVQAAARLRAALRPEDTVARFGGDEFILLCQDLDRALSITGVLGRVIASLSGDYQVAGETVHVTVSIGATVSTGETTEVDVLLSEADAALYAAKRRGRNTYEVFSPDLRESIHRRMQTEHGLRQALAQDGFTLLYQPVHALDTGDVRGAEALLRWDDPLRGRRSPAEFLDVATESGLMIDIGSRVLDLASRQAAHWAAAEPGLVVGVNLTAGELSAPGTPEKVAAALAATGLDPRGLELEITETTLLTDLPAAARALNALRDQGVRVALDDFGTGYSSLTWLQQLPVDTVKLDRSFITDLCRSTDDLAIVRAVIELAHARRLDVVAEGVETPEQLEALRDLGCDLAQGYHLGRPEPPDVLTTRFTLDLTERRAVPEDAAPPAAR